MNARRLIALLGMLAVSGLFFFGMHALGLLRVDEAVLAFRERGGWVLAGAGAQIVTLALGVWRLHILLALFGTKVPPRRIAGATVLSQAIGQYLPGSMAATELIRVGLLLGIGKGTGAHAESGQPQTPDPDLSSRLVLASVLDRILGLGAMLVFGGVTALVLVAWPGASVHAPTVVIGYAVVSLAGGGVLLALPIAGKLWRHRATDAPWGGGRPGRIAGVLARLHSLFRVWIEHGGDTRVAGKLGKLTLAAVIGAATLATSCLTVWLPARGGTAPVPFWPLVAVIALVSMATLLPLGLAGFGSQQAFSAIGLAAFGVSSSAVVTASLIQTVVALLVQTALGAISAAAFSGELRVLYRRAFQGTAGAGGGGRGSTGAGGGS